MTLPAAPFTPKAGRRSCKMPLPRRLLKPRSAVSAMPTGLQRSLWGALDPFHRDVTRRFGLITPISSCRPGGAEILDKLWDFATSAYLDNPIPSLFKERLFVFLSRFCQVRYCIVRHCGFLVGYGHSSGDPLAAPQTIEQALKLLKVPPPWRRQLDPIYERLAAFKTPIDWPEPDSDVEDWIFAASALIFVNRQSPSAPSRHCGKHWAANALSICSRFSPLSELLIIGPWYIPASKSRMTLGR